MLLLDISKGILILSLLINSLLYSQNLRFDHITTKDGLISNSINCLFQDSKGFIWIGTADGLNKYDGTKFIKYQHDPYDHNSISDNTIYNICEDTESNLWIGTFNGGLNKFNRRTQTFTSYKNNPNDSNSLSNNNVSAICIDNTNNPWILNDHCLQYFDRVKNKFFRFNETGGCYNSMIYGKDNCLWYLNGDLIKYDIGKHRFTKYTSNIGFIESIYEDKSGVIWIGADGYLYRFQKDLEIFSWFKVSPKNYTKDGTFKIRSIREENDDILWLGTRGAGLLRYSRKTGAFSRYCSDPTDPNSLSNNNIYSILIDKSGTLWASTYGGGINKYSIYNNKFNQIRYNPLYKNGLNDSFIFPIIEDDEGNLVIGTFNGGLNILNRKSGLFSYQRKAGNRYGFANAVQCLLKDKNNIIFVGTNDNLFLFDQNSGSIRDISSAKILTSNRKIRIADQKAIYKDRSGFVWVGTKPDGLIQFDNNRQIKNQYLHSNQDQNSISDNEVTYIYEDSKSNLWIGTAYGGLNKLDRTNNKFLHYRNNPNCINSISHNCIKVIFEDKNNILWVGTAGGGLNKLVSDKVINSDSTTEIFAHYTHKDGLANDAIYGILEDQSGNLWISTNNGLSKFNPDSKTFRNYDISDGLINNEFNTSSFFKNKEGIMHFGGLGGIIYFDPESIKDNSSFPPVVITSIKILDREIRNDIFSDEEIFLKYDENFINFEFSALDYTNPRRNQYSYQMVGVDKNWVNCGNNSSISFPNLDPGEYLFKLKGTNNDGLWSKNILSVKVVISPPLWKSWPAYIFYIVIFLGFLFLFLRYKAKEQANRLNQVIQQSRNIIRSQENERKRISRELHDSVNQILLSTKLKINSMDISKENETEEVKELIDSAINEIRTISHNLHPMILDDLGLLGAVLSLSKKFKTRTNIDVEIEANNFPKHLAHDIQINLYRMIQEALNNIEKHSGATEVLLSFFQKDDLYIVIVKDNGIGFHIHAIKPVLGEKINFGLSNMRERSTFLNASFEINSSPGKGTEIIIKIPIKNNKWKK